MVVYVTLVLVAILIPHTIKSDVEEALQILTPLESLSDIPTKEELKLAVRYIADKYILDYEKLYRTIACESGFQHSGIFGDWSNIQQEYLAYGVAQFHKETFDHFCYGSYYSAKDQLICLAEMWSNGYQKHWSCYK